MYKLFNLLILILIVGCGEKIEKIKPKITDITESIYASGSVKSKGQYQVFATANGIIKEIFVNEGSFIKKGDPILSIDNEVQLLNKENAELAAQFSDFNTNQGKLNEAKAIIELTKSKMKIDSALYYRQKALWEQQIGSKIEFEQKELAYQNSKTSYYSALVKYEDLKRQLNFSSNQSKKNLQLSNKVAGDYIVRSELDGTVYNLFKRKGEIVGPQTPLAIVGESNQFILEMQIDENDIFKIKKGMKVLVTMDSYKGQVFEAEISKVFPMMNERSKSFLAEAIFIKAPEILYPNITFEANIILQTKEKAMIIPRNYIINDSFVLNSNNEKIPIKTGIKDYKNIEIISGINQNEELIKPKE